MNSIIFPLETSIFVVAEMLRRLFLTFFLELRSCTMSNFAVLLAVVDYQNITRDIAGGSTGNEERWGLLSS